MHHIRIMTKESKQQAQHQDFGALKTFIKYIYQKRQTKFYNCVNGLITKVKTCLLFISKY